MIEQGSLRMPKPLRLCLFAFKIKRGALLRGLRAVHFLHRAEIGESRMAPGDIQ